MNSKVHQRHPFPVARAKVSIAPPVNNRSAMRSEESARHFAWVDWLIARTGKTDASLAKDAGLPSNYLYRKRSDGTVLGATQIRVLTEFWRLPGPDTYLLPGAGGLSDEGALYDPAVPGLDSITKAMIELAIKNRPNATTWILKTRALEDAGYLPGDIIISDAKEHPMPGDAVVAQVYDLRTGMTEPVFRISEPPYLIAASSDPGLRKPLLVDNERVIIMGIITQSFRGRRR